MSELAEAVRRIIAETGPVTTGDLLARVHEAGLRAATPEQLIGLLEAGKAQGIFAVSVERRAGTFSLGYPQWRLTGQSLANGQCREPVLVWDKPPKAESYEDWASYQADSAPPGTYVPNMNDDWKRAWKATMAGQRSRDLRIEVRKSVQVRHAGSVQVKAVVYETGDVLMSMNGVAGFSPAAWAELQQAVTEAHDAMRSYRAVYPAPLPPRDEKGRKRCHFCNQGYTDDLRRRCDQCRPAPEAAAT
jgi:hypothetical protein